MEQLVVIIVAYLLGGIPTAYLAARVQSGIDLSRHGTGNVGASNYIRQIGPVSYTHLTLPTSDLV